MKLNNDIKEHICSICGNKYIGYGNNARPINDGRCCNACNSQIVIPRRIQDVINMKEQRRDNQ